MRRKSKHIPHQVWHLVKLRRRVPVDKKHEKDGVPIRFPIPKEEVARAIVNRKAMREEKKYPSFRYGLPKDEYDIPKPLRHNQRTPFPTSVRILIKRARLERRLNKELPERPLEPPANGLLLRELFPLARQVYRHTIAVRRGVIGLLNSLPVHRCKCCPELYVGRVGHEIRSCNGPGQRKRNSLHAWESATINQVFPLVKSYHIYDRVGNPRVTNRQKFIIPRIPAVVELCIQAGLNLSEIPTRRRKKPVYMVSGYLTDFERMSMRQIHRILRTRSCRVRELYARYPRYLSEDQIEETGVKTLEAWQKMREGAKELMKTFPVHSCGFCTHIQVGVKGHKVRTCKASNHQQRDAQHAWQEATIDDLFPPAYVWHCRDLNGPALRNEQRPFYGKVPVIVALCVHAGAALPSEYEHMSRQNVVLPAWDEADIVA